MTTSIVPKLIWQVSMPDWFMNAPHRPAESAYRAISGAEISRIRTAIYCCADAGQCGGGFRKACLLGAIAIWRPATGWADVSRPDRQKYAEGESENSGHRPPDPRKSHGSYSDNGVNSAEYPDGRRYKNRFPGIDIASIRHPTRLRLIGAVESNISNTAFYANDQHRAP